MTLASAVTKKIVLINIRSQTKTWSRLRWKKLETVVHALTRKVLSLEVEINNINKKKEVIEIGEETDIEFKNISNTHPFKHTSSHIIKAKDPGVKVRKAQEK